MTPLVPSVLAVVDRLGISDYDAAAAAGLGTNYVRNLRTGRVSNPGLEDVQKLITALGWRISLTPLDERQRHRAPRAGGRRYGSRAVPPQLRAEWRKLRGKGVPPRDAALALGLEP